VLEDTQVGAYRVLRRIGEGGMGSVWLAEHTMLGRRAALKVLHPEYTRQPEIVKRFFNEARAATAIADPGIVQIFDFGHHSDGSAYIVMELLDGEPLDRRLARQGALGLHEALRIMRQVASSLGAAHARGIIHRDLKPENVFIVRDPEVAGGERARILDFGIAKLIGDHGGVKTHAQAVMGTPTYMSPEQCRGAGLVDQRSDVYALGCVLFTLLVGRPPFDAEGVGDIIAMHLREAPPLLSGLRPGIPLEIDRLVLRCLAKDPAQRFDNGGELASALDNLLAAPTQLRASSANMIYAVSLPTTLSSAARAALAVSRARTRRAAVFAGVGVAGIIGVTALMVTRDSAESASTQLASPPAPAPTAAVETLTTPAAKASEPNAEISARTKDILTRFIAWSRTHQNAPCPDISVLGDQPRDPWGHAFRLTCTDQPGDQIIGAISAGPDGMSSTVDDIASWLLGRDVTDLVRGVRWAAAAPLLSTPVNPDRRSEPDAKYDLRTPFSPPLSVNPAGIRAAEAAGVAKPKRANQPKQIEVDENGLPTHR
jgi:serine/threonine protein kinase